MHQDLDGLGAINVFELISGCLRPQQECVKECFEGMLGDAVLRSSYSDG